MATEIELLGNLWAAGSHRELKMLWDPQGCTDFWMRVSQRVSPVTHLGPEKWVDYQLEKDSGSK